MRRMRAIVSRIAGLFGTTRADREFAEEIATHLQLHTDDNIRAGLSPDESRRRALIALGGIERAKEEHRDRRGFLMVETVIRDLRYGSRTLARNPWFSVAAIVILGLGIGVNTAIFTMVNAVLLRPLPFPHADRVMRIWHTPPPALFTGRQVFSLSPANFEDWKEQSRSFERMAIYRGNRQVLTGQGEPDALNTTRASASLLPILGLAPRIGHGFTEEDDRAGGSRTALLSEGTWRTRFGGDASVVGRPIVLDGESYTVIGVVPDAAVLFDTVQVWLPLAWTPADRAVRNNHNYRAIAMLRPGVTVAMAQADLTAIARRLETAYPADNKDWGALVLPLHEDMVGEVQTSLVVLLGAVLLVLLIACANLANLMLVRTHGRGKEIALRTALGASRARVVQQLLVEGALVGAAGGAAGLAAAIASVGILVRAFGPALPRASEITLDGRVLAFTAAISLVTGLLAALAPAWRLTGRDVNEVLKQGAGRGNSAAGDSRVRHLLVVSEVALALMLLIGAGLLMRSLAGLRAVDPGFDSRNLLTATVEIPAAKYPTLAARAGFFDRAVQAIGALPGVEAVATVDTLPLQGGSSQPVLVEGAPPVSEAERPVVAVRMPSAGYFTTARIPIVAGREFSAADGPERPLVAIVSELAAARFWPNQNPLGKRVTLSLMSNEAREIVGVVREVKTESLDERVAETALYIPAAQVGLRGSTLIVRTSVRPETLTRSLIGAVQSLDPQQPVLNIETMEVVLERSLGQRQSAMQLLGGFALLALLLAAVGIYSVLAYTVRQRIREIGIRLALGAPTTNVLRLVVFEGMKPAMAGIALGLVLAAALGRVLSTLLYGVGAHDAVTFSGVALMLTAVGFGATVLPAYRATRVNPVVALRSE